MKRFGLPKSKRLRNNADIKRVLDYRLRVSDGVLTLCMAPNKAQMPRLGISVSKRCGPAVIRNRLKRLIREVFRQNCHEIPAQYDYVVMISKTWLACLQAENPAQAVKIMGYKQLEDRFLALISRAEQKIRPRTAPGQNAPEI